MQKVPGLQEAVEILRDRWGSLTFTPRTNMTFSLPRAITRRVTASFNSKSGGAGPLEQWRKFKERKPLIVTSGPAYYGFASTSLKK